MQYLQAAKFIEEFSDLSELLKTHILDNDEYLPHLFMADIVRHVVAAATGNNSDLVESQASIPDGKIPSLLEYLEDSFLNGDDEDRNVIALSFLENLPYHDEPGHELADQLPPALLQEFAIVRPAG